MASKIGPTDIPIRFRGEAEQLDLTLKQIKEGFSSVKKIASARFNVDALDVLELEAKAGIKPLKDLEKALQDTIATAKKGVGTNPDLINRRVLAETTIKLREVQKELNGVQNVLDRNISRLNNFSQKIQGALLPLGVAAAGLTAGLGVSANAFSNFEKSLNTIKGVAEATTADIERIRDSSLELGKATIFSSQQVVDSFKELAKAGFTTQESLAAMPALLDLAAAAGGDLELAASTVSQSMKAFGINASQTGRFVDVLAAAANKSAADIADMGLAFKQVAPLAQQTGQSVESLGSLLAVLANNAVKGADAGSDLRNIITRFLNPTKEASAVMAKLNISLKDQKGQVKDLSQFFQELNSKLNALTPAARSQAAAILAGQENLKSFLILAGTSPQELQEMDEALQLAGGSAKDMADTINSGLFSALEQLSGTVETLQIQLGQYLAPAIKEVVTGLTAMLSAIGNNQSIVAFTAAFAATVAVILTAQVAIGGLIAALTALGTALGGLPLLATIGVVGSLATAVGIATAAFTEHERVMREADKTISDYNRETQDVIATTQAETSNIIKSAEAYDRIAKQTNLTAKQKVQLEQALTRVKNALPGLQVEIDKTTGLVRNLAQSAREAAAALLLTTAIKNYDKQIEAQEKIIQQAEKAKRISDAQAKAPFLFLGNPKDDKKLGDSLQKQKLLLEDLKEKRKDVGIEVAKAIKDEAAAEAAAAKSQQQRLSGTGGLGAGTAKKKKTKSESEQKTALESFKKLIEQMEVELTGLAEGQFAEQRAQAEKTYADRVRQIQDLGKKGKIAEAELSKAFSQAADVRKATLNKIATQEADFIEKRKQTIQGFTHEYLRAAAQLTVDNPFDDITANAQIAGDAIRNNLINRIQELKLQFAGNEKNEGFQDGLKKAKEAAQKNFELLEQQTEIQIQSISRLAEHTLREAEAVEAELSQNTIEIAKKQTEALIDEQGRRLEELFNTSDKMEAFRLAQEARAKLRSGIELTEEDFAKFTQVSLILANMEKLKLKGSKDRLELELQQKQALLDTEKALSKGAANKTSSLERQKKLYGEILALQKEQLELTGEDLEAREKITQSIFETARAQAEAGFKTSRFGQILDGLNNINLPQGRYNQFFNTVLEGLNSGANAWLDYKAAQTAAAGDTGKLAQASTLFKDSIINIGAGLATAIAQQVGGSGAAIGSTVGGIVGAIAGSFIPGGTQIGAAIGSAAGGLFGSLFGGSAKKKARQEAASTALINDFVTRARSFTDSVNRIKNLAELQRALVDGQARLDELIRLRDSGTLRGEAVGRANQLVSDMISQQGQILDQIISIQEQIAERDRTLAFDILDAQAARTIQQIDDIVAKYQRALSDINQAMNQAQREGTATTTFLEAIELQRQRAQEEASAAIIDAVISEQNKVRELRAQQAVDEAKAAGKGIAIINAELQQQLVALENEIAAFKGSEEEKTEFLRAKSAERNRIVQDSQKQLDGLLQQGLDILNEGLVSAETKAESQSRRLQNLFGTLNPFGEITQGSQNLLQTTVNVGSGAFTFVLQGIQDAQALIAQLKNPLVQAELQAALNTATARQ